MLSYAGICFNMLPYAVICSHMLSYAVIRCATTAHLCVVQVKSGGRGCQGGCGVGVDTQNKRLLSRDQSQRNGLSIKSNGSAAQCGVIFLSCSRYGKIFDTIGAEVGDVDEASGAGGWVTSSSVCNG